MKQVKLVKNCNSGLKRKQKESLELLELFQMDIICDHIFLSLYDLLSFKLG